ncbi:MAG: hypothetical protein IKL98_03170, partial [Akkermansia sp.]|nr:hypothetical protein [Akkermansia sp.]
MVIMFARMGELSTPSGVLHCGVAALHKPQQGGFFTTAQPFFTAGECPQSLPFPSTPSGVL